VKALRLCYVAPAASVTTRRWVEWFAARGHETTVVTVEPAGEGEHSRFRQIDVSVAGRLRKLCRLRSAVRMAGVIRRLKPDVVHVHYAKGLAWGLLLTRPHPCVVTPWGSDVLGEQQAFREPYSRPLTRSLLGMADLVTVHSDFMESHVRALLPAASPLARIGWGVDLGRFRPGLDVRPIRERWGIGEDRRVIFSPRLAQPFYQHDRVIRALPAICEKVPGADLIIPEQSADRIYVEGLRRLAARLGVADRLRIVPAIPYADMPLWLNLADAVVMVPRSDGMPNTLWEAMACGAAPVLNRLPQYAGVVRHGVNGFLVDPDGDLVGALIGLLGDPVLRATMARRNVELAKERGDQDQEMSRMEGWYYQLAEHVRHRRHSAG
jgi:glycosyltransferase involved in cell wall biosynthesis